METFFYRYNRFSDSYLINYKNYEFEAEPELFTILLTYASSQNKQITLKILKNKGIYLTENSLTNIISMIEGSARTHSPKLQNHTFKVIDFKIFNSVLKHKLLMWMFFLLSVLITISNTQFALTYLTISKPSSYTFASVMLIIPIYYLSRIIFVPFHEFGHNFFYYLFTGKSATFYIQIPGFLYFGGLTTTDDLFYLKNPLKRIFISLGGVYFEVVLLIFFLLFTRSFVDLFILQLLTIRVFLSIIFNLNILSQSTDGHVLLTDLLGITTFAETYSDYLRHLINPNFTPAVNLPPRVRALCLIYTIAGVSLIILLVYSQLYFFLEIIQLITAPLTKLSVFSIVNIFELCCLLLTYLYYIDLLVRLYRKKIILYQMIRIRKNEELL